jgi:hypothetical protein
MGYVPTKAGPDGSVRVTTGASDTGIVVSASGYKGVLIPISSLSREIANQVTLEVEEEH